MSFVREEGLVESKWKLNLVRFQVGAFFILSFICFVLEFSNYKIPGFVFLVLIALILTLTSTIIFLKYVKKNLYPAWFLGDEAQQGSLTKDKGPANLMGASRATLIRSKSCICIRASTGW